ncbi:hypothetical protein ACU610_08615 [Geodermatophilus sp. URMC 61]|uniref:hypothetical protein n=1 Tax=Geodermatophilus sp. URMC 61 TaxID=3423411 RepID=UPI00406CEF15
MLDRLLLPPRPPAHLDHEEKRPHLDVPSDAVRDVEEHLALVEARPAALVHGVRADVRRVHP